MKNRSGSEIEPLLQHGKKALYQSTASSQEINYFDLMPDEIILEIAFFLTLHDLAQFARTQKRMQGILFDTPICTVREKDPETQAVTHRKETYTQVKAIHQQRLKIRKEIHDYQNAIKISRLGIIEGEEVRGGIVLDPSNCAKISCVGVTGCLSLSGTMALAKFLGASLAVTSIAGIGSVAATVLGYNGMRFFCEQKSQAAEHHITEKQKELDDFPEPLLLTSGPSV